MIMPERATAIATRVMLEQSGRSGPFDYGAVSAMVHEAAVRVYEVMHAENERLLKDCQSLQAMKRREQDAKERLDDCVNEMLSVCKKSLAALEHEHRERQERLDQIQDEWNHRHADDINVPNDPAIWNGVEAEEPPVLSHLRAVITKMEGA